jgi:hypothetical protein
MSSVAELKKKFAGNNKVLLTPEQHAATLRQKERDQSEAVKIAKARASRYNLTLRSLELANADKSKPQNLGGRRASRAPKPIQLRVTGIQKGPVAEALSHKRSPSVAKEVVETMAEHVQAEMQKTEAEVKKEDEEAAKIAAEKEAANKAAAEAEAANKAAAAAAAAAAEAEAAAAAAAATTAAEESSVDHGATFEMTSLQKAIETGDADEINKAIVTEFLQEHAPSEATPQKVEELLSQNEGKEAELMQELAKKYDDPVEQEITVMKEVIEKVESGETTMEDLGSSVAAASPPTPPPQVVVVVQETTTTTDTKPTEDTPKPTEENNEEGVEDDLMQEAERIKLEEEQKVAAMDDTEREHYLQQLAQSAKHEEDKDRMLKSQLNVYTSGGTNILAGKGRGRGRGKRPVSTTPGGAVEYIVNGSNEGGEWSVNNEV